MIDIHINNSNFNRLLQNNIERMSQLTNQLSTGKRITQASEDASGLQVSTRLTSQIRGSKQAVRNIEDGISLLKTTDGSLSTVQEMLQRMRELAVQGQNGTYNLEQKASIEKEMNSLVEGINQVANSSTFNGIHLLKSDLSVLLSGEKAKNQSVKIDNVPVNTAPGAKTTVEFWMNWDGTPAAMPFGWDTSYAVYLREDTIGFNTANSNVLGVSSDGIKNKWTHITAVFTNGVPDQTNVELYINGEKQTISDQFSPTLSSRTVTPTLYVGNWNGPNPGTDFGGKIDDLKIWDGTRTEEEIKEDMYKNHNGDEEGLIGYWKFNDTMLKDETANGNNGQFMDGATLEEGVSKTLSIHSGNESNSKDELNLFSVSGDTLNLSSSSLNDPNIIKKIDNAINAISLQRGEIGAKINRYGFKVDNQQNLINNTESAKMRIEDQDMASAMSELTKEEILMNSVQRMISVSNSNFEKQMQMLFS